MDTKKWMKIENVDASGLDLLDKMLIFDPSKHISAKACLQHPDFDVGTIRTDITPLALHIEFATKYYEHNEFTHNLDLLIHL